MKSKILWIVRHVLVLSYVVSQTIVLKKRIFKGALLLIINFNLNYTFVNMITIFKAIA